jgi:PIN domain nuclease of toxin-antitoxin system
MILLDTHAVLWLSLEPERLSHPAVYAIREARAGSGLAISPVSLFEIAHLIARKRIDVKIPIEAFLNEIQDRFVLKHMNVQIAIVSAQLSDRYPRDPMRRLIGATAIVERMPLVTADERIRESGCLETIW